MILLRPDRSTRVRTLRYLLCWYFWILFVSTACVLVGIESHRWFERTTSSNASLPIRFEITIAVAMILAASTFAKAWWVLWHEKLSARVWCIAASATSLVLPVLLVILCVLGGQIARFWPLAIVFVVAIAIGIGGILFGVSDAAKPLSPVARPHLGHAIVTSIFLFGFAFNFVRGAVACVIRFMDHKGVPASYFVGLFLCGFLTLAALWLLRRELRDRGTEPSEATRT